MYFKTFEKNQLIDNSGAFSRLLKPMKNIFFDQLIKTLDPSFSKQLTEHYTNRIKRADGRPMLGEQAVTIFSDLFSISKKTSVLVEYPWFLLYESALLFDDLLDGNRAWQKIDLILSQKLADRARTEINAICGSNADIDRLFEKYRDESWTAMCHEIECSKNLYSSKGNISILQQGRKAALAKFCATLLLYIDRQKLLTTSQEKGIDLLCSGIQMLDDVADFNQDYSHGINNFLLQSSIEWLKKYTNYQNDELAKLGSTQLRVTLVLSLSISKTWTIAAKRIERALELLGAFSSSETEIYFHKLAKDCHRSSSNLLSLIAMKDKEWTQVKSALLIGEEYLIRELGSETISELWQEICVCLTEGPKASN